MSRTILNEHIKPHLEKRHSLLIISKANKFNDHGIHTTLFYTIFRDTWLTSSAILPEFTSRLESCSEKVLTQFSSLS